MNKEIKNKRILVIIDNIFKPISILAVSVITVYIIIEPFINI